MLNPINTTETGIDRTSFSLFNRYNSKMNKPLSFSLVFLLSACATRSTVHNFSYDVYNDSKFNLIQVPVITRALTYNHSNNVC